MLARACTHVLSFNTVATTSSLFQTRKIFNHRISDHPSFNHHRTSSSNRVFQLYSTALIVTMCCWPFIGIELEEAPPPQKKEEKEVKEEPKPDKMKGDYVLVSDKPNMQPLVSSSLQLHFSPLPPSLPSSELPSTTSLLEIEPSLFDFPLVINDHGQPLPATVS